jgi:hypothetical protein
MATAAPPPPPLYSLERMKDTEQLLRKYELHNQEQDQSLDVVKRGGGEDSCLLTFYLLQVRKFISRETIFRFPKYVDEDFSSGEHLDATARPLI